LTRKEELVGMTMTLMEFKNKWEGIIRNLTKDDFARALVRLRKLRKYIFS
jgi:hypothetical protein